jgi:hypothetical protein
VASSGWSDVGLLRPLKYLLQRADILDVLSDRQLRPVAFIWGARLVYVIWPKLPKMAETIARKLPCRSLVPEAVTLKPMLAVAMSRANS